MPSSPAPTRTERLLTPRQAADMVGVSESTVRRWCDDLEITTAKTSGGHRRIQPASLLAFARRAGFAPRPAPVLSGRGGRAVPLDELASRFFRSLVSDDHASARGFVAEWVAQRGEIDVLFDDLVTPAMTRVGREWESGALAVFEEHRATARAQAAVCAVEALISAPSKSAPVAVCAALAGDPYSLAPSMAAAIVQAEGLRPMLLGPDTPGAELRRAASVANASLVIVSIGAVTDPDRLRVDIEALLDWARSTGAAVALGGRALEDVLRGGPLSADLVGGGMRDLRRLAGRRRRAGRTATARARNVGAAR